jgi:UDP-apiose/xylose synthase
MTRVVMLGCGGFIGSHLLDRMLPDPTVVVEGWDPDPRKIAHHRGRPNLTLHPTYLQDDPAALRRAVARADVVLSLAAIANPSQYNTRPVQVIESNFLDLYPLVELCAASGTHLIHISTSEVYGRTISSYLPGDDYSSPDLYELDEASTPLVMGPIRNQRWTYACAKQLLERFIFAHHHESGLPFTIVRPLNFFGPRMDFIPGRDGDGLPRVLACFMAALMEDRPLQLVDGGVARRTIVSIHDAIDALETMVREPERVDGRIVNIGNRGNEVTIAELADLMRRTYADITGDPAYRFHPIESVSSADFYGEGYEDCDRRMPKLDLARELLGWEPRLPLPAILAETMRYYHDTYVGEKVAA